MFKLAHRLIRGRAGFTLIELMVAASILTIVVLGSSELFIDYIRNSSVEETQAQADTDVALALEQIRGLLAEARTFTVDANGCGISFQYPAMVNPAEPNSPYVANTSGLDNTVHRIYLSNGAIYADSMVQPILTNVPAIDPATSLSILPFQPGYNTKQIILRLVEARSNNRNVLMYSSVTTVVQPNNM